MEEQLESVNNSLEQARKRLPQSFKIDKIIKSLSKIATETDVKIHMFEPLNSYFSTTAFQYIKKPIKISISGKFKEISNFMSKVLHLEFMVRIFNYDLTLVTKEKDNLQKSQSKNTVTDEEKAILARENSTINVSFDLYVYRSLTSEETKKQEEKRIEEKQRSRSRRSSLENHLDKNSLKRI